MKLTLGVLLVYIVASAKARDDRQLFSSAGLVFPGPRTQKTQQQQQGVQQREPLVAQQSAKAVQVDNSPFIPAPNNIPNQRPVLQQDGPLFRTNQQIPPSRPNQFLNPNLGFAPPQQSQPSFTGAPQQQFQDRPNPFSSEFQPQQQDRPIPQKKQAAPQQERLVPPPNRPFPQQESFPQQDRPGPQQNRPVPLQDRPFPPQDRDRPFAQQDRPFAQQDRPFPQPGRPVPPPERQVPPPPFSLAGPSNGSPFSESTGPTFRPSPQTPTTPRPVPVRTTPRPTPNFQQESDDFFAGEEEVAPPPAPSRPQKIRNEARRPEAPAPQKPKYQPENPRPQYNKKQQGNGNPEKPKKRPTTTTTTPAPVADYEEEEEEREEEYVPDQLTLRLQETEFSCKDKKDGYYADETLDCEVFHYCQVGDRHSWLCPAGAIFHQVHLICMPVSDDNICKKSSQFHFVNDYLYKTVDDGRDNSTGVIYADRYYPEDYEHGVPYDMAKVEAPKKPDYKPYNQAVVNKKPTYVEQKRRPQYQSQPQYTQARQNFQDEQVERQVAPEVREEEPAQRRQFTEPEPESKPEEVKETEEPSQEREHVEAEEKADSQEAEESAALRRVIRPALTSSEEVISS